MSSPPPRHTTRLPSRGTRAPALLSVLAAALSVAAVVLLHADRKGEPSGSRADGSRQAQERDAPSERAVEGRRGRRSTGAASRTGRARGRPAPRARFRNSRALGLPSAGRLVDGVQLPARGAHYLTWDPILRRSPNRGWRRHGTDDLVRLLLRVQRRYGTLEPGARPLLIGDLSRPRGGDFGRRYGIIGHSTHQNGLDADVYYPRRDRRLTVPKTVAQVDLRLSQRLLDLFVAAGAQTVLVGPNTDLKGQPGVVKPYPNHDNHMHVRIANPWLA